MMPRHPTARQSSDARCHQRVKDMERDPSVFGLRTRKARSPKIQRAGFKLKLPLFVGKSYFSSGSHALATGVSGAST
jgi:hypothetical protein